MIPIFPVLLVLFSEVIFWLPLYGKFFELLIRVI